MTKRENQIPSQKVTIQSVHISKVLAGKMDKHKGVNWSRVAQKAFNEHLTKLTLGYEEGYNDGFKDGQADELGRE